MSDYDGEEVAWPAGPVEARLEAGRRLGTGEPTLRLHFTNPKTGRDVDIAISALGESTKYEHVWAYTIEGAEIVVTPSVHFIGHFHTPKPVRFRLVGVSRVRA